jgi:hypothetical protein
MSDTVENRLDAWRTSCPRLPVWEEANSRGFIELRNGPESTVAVSTLVANICEHVVLAADQRALSNVTNRSPRQPAEVICSFPHPAIRFCRAHCL